MIEELLTNLNENPPSSPEELEAMLAETGYEIVPAQGDMMEEEMGMEPDMPMEEEVLMEAPEDMGPEEAMMEEEMPMPPIEMLMGEAPSRRDMSNRTRSAARKALMG